MKRYYIKKGKLGIVIANQNRRKHNLQRFIELTKTDPLTECIIWLGSTNEQGYGQISVDNTTLMAHTMAYKLFIGPLENDLEIDHLCCNRNCINPFHLEAVTHSENMKRIRQHNPLIHCKRGHLFTPDNTYVDRRGKRTCKICRQMRSFLRKKGTTLSRLEKNLLGLE